MNRIDKILMKEFKVKTIDELNKAIDKQIEGMEL